ncbi:MAG: ABC transporter permease [Acidimicrobiia bacterium]
MRRPTGANHPVLLVTRREIVERVRAKSFLISTGVYLLVALASIIIPNLLADNETVHRIGVAGTGSEQLQAAITRLAPPLDTDVVVRRLPDAAAAAAAVRDRTVRIAIVDSARLVSRGEVDEELALLVNTAAYQVMAAARLAEAGVSPVDAARLLNPEPLAVDQLVEPRPVRESNRPLAFTGVLVIYLLLLTYGFTVANGVLEEKSSRVSEVLLGALRPSQLLAGKVIGIGGVAVIQLLMVSIPALATALAFGSFSLPEGTPLTLLAVLLWSLLGYGLYSCIFAAAGAAASRPEDVGNATAPITMLIAATYFVAVGAMQDPDGTMARVVSFIPPMTPMTMLPRSAVGHVEPWEVPLAIALVLFTTFLTVRLGARVYAGGMRRPGPKLKLREAWRAAAG